MFPNPELLASSAHPVPSVATTSARDAAGYRNMLHLIQLRWIAVVGQISTIAGVTLGFGIVLPLDSMIKVLVCLIAFNIASQLRLGEQRMVTNNALFLALLVDVASLTGQLYFSGGITNPFAFLYLLQVILGAVLLDVWSTWTIVGITSACLAGLALLSKPLQLQQEHVGQFFSLYVQGMLVCFALNAALLVIFITRINANLRAGDAQLAHLRQRAAEEEHIVRIGLLASGAAHELGTPLATLAVILGDWRRMPEFSRNPELQEEITEMQVQLQRCKAIVSGILMSAGEARGESSVKTTLNTFLNELVEAWRASRPIDNFVYQNHIVQDVPVVFDSTLKQMIWNVLDNAAEASPHWVSLEVTREADMLRLSVSDAGAGFTPAMLTHFGKPYQSSKGSPGRGLGLFLSVNVARTLGGSVTAENRKDGGAVVHLKLPLAAIALDAGAGG
ncbi:two-component system sensor histidine kinase RegB [Actimicrobium sp. GrIS 1.19]|uniref:ATP-binding protein n=1 Tax=Actimicrobium sp. GrIS 1.19 TaxID=3071708 RepID=UPI002DFD871F|nr:two-component system sensor histidine kinase RegB [Actimicrobium sp. GrIS 1.19]